MVEVSGYGKRSREINGTVARYLCVIVEGIFPIWTFWLDILVGHFGWIVSELAGANSNPVDRPGHSRNYSPGSWLFTTYEVTLLVRVQL